MSVATFFGWKGKEVAEIYEKLTSTHIPVPSQEKNNVVIKIRNFLKVKM